MVWLDWQQLVLPGPWEPLSEDLTPGLFSILYCMSEFQMEINTGFERMYLSRSVELGEVLSCSPANLISFVKIERSEICSGVV